MTVLGRDALQGVGDFSSLGARRSVGVFSAIDRAAEALEKLVLNARSRVIMYTESFAIHEQVYQTRSLDFGLLTYLRMTLGTVRPHRYERQNQGRLC
jgi:hypothetical protein